MNHSRATKRKGQSIIEAMIAISILTAGFLGIAGLLVRSLQLSRTTSDDITATYLASEGVELMKNITDHDVYAKNPWGTCTNQFGFPTCAGNGAYTVNYNSASPALIGGPGAECFTSVAVPALDYDASTGLYGDAGTASRFSRCIEITHSADREEMTVNSIVEWTTNGVQSSLNLEDHFYNWNPGS
jgi:Tfp pilus assembly protein PilV